MLILVYIIWLVVFRPKVPIPWMDFFNDTKQGVYARYLQVYWGGNPRPFPAEFRPFVFHKLPVIEPVK